MLNLKLPGCATRHNHFKEHGEGTLEAAWDDRTKLHNRPTYSTATTAVAKGGPQACEGKGWASSSGSCCRELADPAPELPPCADLHAELRVDGVQQPGHMRDAAELRGVCEQGVDATA